MKLIFVLMSAFTFQAAALEAVTLSTKDALPAPRWMYGIGQPPKPSEKDPSSLLAQVKRAQVDGDWSACADRAKAARARAKSLQSWLSVIELECAVKAKPTQKSGSALSRAVDEAAAHAEWFAMGPQAFRLKSAFASALTTLIDQDVKVNRARAWKSVERIDEFATFMDDKTKAFAWRTAGDLSVAQSKPEAARDFYKRSLLLGNDSDTRARLAAVERALGLTEAAKSLSQALKPAVNPAVNPTLNPTLIPAPTPASAGADVEVSPTPSESIVVSEATNEELELAERATAAFKSGDVVVATELATQIIRKFPSGSRAKWASDRIQETLASFADKTDPKYQDLHDQVVERVQKADADRLADWARSCYNRAQFRDAFALAQASLKSVDGARRSKSLELAGQSALAIEDWSAARSAFTELIEKSAGQSSAHEALFRLGLLNYREQKFNDAITDFERLIALPQAETLELGSRYWLWRSLQKTKAERATQIATDLMTKFPFSYYGLRARLEQGGGLTRMETDDARARKSGEYDVARSRG